MSKNQEYIKAYKEYAIEQMWKYGIPASVTLAQGIAETDSGTSETLKLSNNHFGIKATQSWLNAGGKWVPRNDNKPDEKFCVYDSAAASYEHHSKFLRSNSIYTSLFKLDITDYKGWCSGLKTAGYATSPTYAQLLINIIEINNLQEIDKQVIEQMRAEGKSFGEEYNKSQKSATELTVNYSFPVQCEGALIITSPFGERDKPTEGASSNHKGVDIGTLHSPILATENDGKVVSAGFDNNGGGNFVKLEYSREDGSKIQVTYCHLSEIKVGVGDVVKAGQKIGISGSTGTSTGDHLHLGVAKVKGNTEEIVNPGYYLAEIAQKGNIEQKVKYANTGKDYLAEYQTPEDAQSKNMAAAEKVTPDNENYSDLARAIGTNDPYEIMKYMMMKNEGPSLGNGDLLGEIAGMFLEGFAELFSFYMSQKAEKADEQEKVEVITQERIATRQRESIDVRDAKNLMAMNFDNLSQEESLGRGQHIS